MIVFETTDNDSLSLIRERYNVSEDCYIDNLDSDEIYDAIEFIESLGIECMIF